MKTKRKNGKEFLKRNYLVSYEREERRIIGKVVWGNIKIKLVRLSILLQPQ